MSVAITVAYVPVPISVAAPIAVRLFASKGVGLEEIKRGAALAGDGGLAALDAEALPLLLVDEN